MVLQQELLDLIPVVKVTLFIGANMFLEWQMNMANAPVVCADWQKHLGVYLDNVLTSIFISKNRCPKQLRK